MTRTIAQRDLRNDNAAIMDAVAAGEDFVVTRNGTPVARLVPIAHRRRFVPAAELAEWGASGIDAARWRADLDAAADQSVRDR